MQETIDDIREEVRRLIKSVLENNIGCPVEQVDITSFSKEIDTIVKSWRLPEDAISFKAELDSQDRTKVVVTISATPEYQPFLQKLFNQD